jgi:hypothetical protein
MARGVEQVNIGNVKHHRIVSYTKRDKDIDSNVLRKANYALAFSNKYHGNPVIELIVTEHTHGGRLLTGFDGESYWSDGVVESVSKWKDDSLHHPTDWAEERLQEWAADIVQTEWRYS